MLSSGLSSPGGRDDGEGDGSWQPAALRAATLQTVADAAGVHRSTAARALNAATRHLISDEVVARVQAEARRLGYRRDALAASLRTGRSRLVGVLLPDLANPVFAPILGGIEGELPSSGYSALVAHAPADRSTRSRSWSSSLGAGSTA